MRIRSVFSFIFVAIFSVSMHVTSFADVKNIDMQELVRETQKMSRKSDEITMVWWIPETFWSASFAQTQGKSSADVEALLKIFRSYTIIVVVDGKMGAFGGISYKSEDLLRTSTRLVDSQGNSYVPRTENEIDADVKNLLRLLKPVFSNVLGPLGDNMHFMLFPAKGKNGKQIANAKESGQFEVKLGEKEFKWRLPLDALLPVLVCDNCRQEGKGSWSFCPWCGTKFTK